MRKCLVIALAALLAATLAVTLTGCGGEKDLDKAKTLKQEGDIKYDEVDKAGQTLEQKQADITKALISGDKSALTPEQLAQVKSEIEKILAQMESDLLSAKSSYEQTLDLEGVEKYKDYASKMLEVIDKQMELLGQVKGLIDKFVQMLASGTMPDLSSLMESEEFKKINELSKTIDDLEKEAEKLGKDLK